MVKDAFIWVDYMSVPQIGTYLDAGVSDLMKAVESIPAYGESNANATDGPTCPRQSTAPNAIQPHRPRTQLRGRPTSSRSRRQ